jgi:Trypsin-co-occurring domain 2
MSQSVELAEFVAQLREELGRALAEGTEKAIKFACGPIDLEMEVSVERAADAGARIRFWVVDADASGKRGMKSTQRIRMTLTPSAADAPLEQLRILGESVPGER